MVTPSNAILIQLPTIDNKIAAADFVVNHRILLKYASFMAAAGFSAGDRGGNCGLDHWSPRCLAHRAGLTALRRMAPLLRPPYKHPAADLFEPAE